MLRFLVATMLFAVPSTVLAQSYLVHVTREKSNFYKVDGQSFWLITRYCYKYSYSEEAVLGPGRLTFLDSGEQCDVDKILSRSSVAAGNYRVTVSHESDDLFSSLEGFHFKTFACYQYVYFDSAIFRSNGYGGMLVFKNGDACTVEQVLEEVRL